jgi:predicted RecB family endonuclease
MSNSSPTIHEKIITLAKREAYRNARVLGFHPMDAARQALDVAAFINRMVGHTPEGLAR